MGEKRVSVGIRESHHKQLQELAEIMPSVISKLVDRALEEFFEVRGAIYRERARRPAKGSKRNMTPCHTAK